MNVKPLRDFVVVKKEAAEEKVASGLLFRPGNVNDTILTAVVVAVGSGMVCTNGTVVPNEVQVGDRVLFESHHKTEVPIDGEKVYVLREDQILCVLPPKQG